MKQTSAKIYGGIEAGGTKFICAVGTSPTDLTIKRIETTTPQKTLNEVIKFFKPYTAEETGRRLAAIGIASFGPLELNQESSKYGYITNTPKPGWTNVNLAGIIQDALDIPVVIDTDVNGAALGEQEWGAAQGLNTFIYVTLGTGIGGGGIINGDLMHGLVHPEMGHIRIPRDNNDKPGFKGSCKFHKCDLRNNPSFGCWEGLASGASMQQRWGKPPEEILENDKDYNRAWNLEANYIAMGMYNLICTLSPQRIILGGGIMNHHNLLEKVQRKVEKLLNKYIPALDSLEKISNYLVRPALVNAKSNISLSGVLGAIVLAKRMCLVND
ncbi:MAG: ROK family protein [Dehalococcoidales bacterium]